MSIPLKMWTANILLLLAMLINPMDASKYLIQSLQDNIGAENFTYYRLHRPGSLRVELTSVEGDVDIYVSTEHQHPSYNTYDLKSESCGMDIIKVDSSLPRPVFIGLYGHPFYLGSRYHLQVYEVDDPHETTYMDYVNKYERYLHDEVPGESGDKYQKSQRYQGKQTQSEKRAIEEEMPLWWKILLGVLEFGIEVIL